MRQCHVTFASVRAERSRDRTSYPVPHPFPPLTFSPLHLDASTPPPTYSKSATTALKSGRPESPTRGVCGGLPVDLGGTALDRDSGGAQGCRARKGKEWRRRRRGTNEEAGHRGGEQRRSLARVLRRPTHGSRRPVRVGILAVLRLLIGIPSRLVGAEVGRGGEELHQAQQRVSHGSSVIS